MSKKAAESFVEAWGRKDQAIAEVLKVQPKEVLNDPEKLADIAADLGYDVDASDLQEVFAARREESIGALEIKELSSNELEQVSGGTTCTVNGQFCSSDWDPNDTCWFDDRCLNTWHYYKAKGYCKSTMEENENCGNVDRCSSGVVEYPKCHQDVYWGE